MKQVSLAEDVEPSLSRETRGRLNALVDLLVKWSATMNLVSDADPLTIWARHIADSLQLMPLLQGRAPPFVDLGSGAGFPGLVLAIASGWHFHLIEADQRKAAFLREAARTAAAPVTIHADRIEHVRLAPVAAVTARALAPLPRLLGLARPFLRPEGILLCPKGRRAKEELTAARAEWHMRAIATPSRTDSTASILQISEISRVRKHRCGA